MRRTITVVTMFLLSLSVGSFAQSTVEFSGQYRARLEYRNNRDSSKDRADAYAFVNSRLRLSAKATLGENFEIKATLQDARIFGAPGAAISTGTPLEGVGFTATNSRGLESVDLNEAYLRILFNKQLQVVLGRQRLAYGEHRLLGTFDWSNVSNSFDGLKVRYQMGHFQLDGLAFVLRESQVVESTVEKPTGISEGSYLLGAYAQYAMDNLNFDGYALILQDSKKLGGGIGFDPIGGADLALKGNSSIAGEGVGSDSARAANIAALGFRFTGHTELGTLQPFWAVEAVYQTGQAWQYDHSAFAASVRLGTQLGTLPLAPNLFIEYDLASGTDSSDRAAGKRTTFYNFFPTNHIHYGYGDLFSWKNMRGLRIHLDGTLFKQKTLSAQLALDWWKFNLFTTEDYWYHAGQGILVGGAPFSSDDAGQEIDITFILKWKSLKWMSGVAFFTPGQLLKDMGREDAMLWGFSQVTIGF